MFLTISFNAHVMTICAIILVAGILGGIANYFMSNETKTWIAYDLLKSILFGIVASLTVPLFLATLSSDLLTVSQDKPLLYFVFAGFCLIAAIFSTKFLQSLADRILKELDAMKRQVNSNTETVNAIMERTIDDKTVPRTRISKLAFTAGDKMQTLVRSFHDDKYIFRTAKGLAHENNMDESEVTTGLTELEQHGYIRQVPRADGSIAWTLTLKGQRVSVV